MKEDWEVKRIKDICEKASSNVTQQSLKDNTGDYPIYGASGFIKNVNFYHQDKEYIGIVKDGSGIGRTMLLPACSSVIGTIQYILPKKPNKLKFVYYALESLDLAQYKNGAAIPHIYFRDYGESVIAVPPLPEQERIVSILDSAFAKIETMKDNAARNLANAKELFQSELQNAMMPKEGWEVKPLGDVCEIYGRIGFRGYTKKDLVKTPQDGAITLSPSNIIDGEMNYESCSYISWFKYEESPEIMIKKNDILIVKTGSSYGKVAMVTYLPHKATINPQFVVLKGIKTNPGFLTYFLKTKDVKQKYDEFVSGTAIPTFSQARLRELKVNIPSLSDQQQIVSRLDALSEKVKELEAAYNKALADCEELKQSLLRQAFNGEL